MAGVKQKRESAVVQEHMHVPLWSCMRAVVFIFKLVNIMYDIVGLFNLTGLEGIA